MTDRASASVRARRGDTLVGKVVIAGLSFSLTAFLFAGFELDRAGGSSTGYGPDRRGDSPGTVVLRNRPGITGGRGQATVASNPPGASSAVPATSTSSVRAGNLDRPRRVAKSRAS